jgi:HAD superfamily hydrolase (TIGR01509 family)
MDGVLIDSHPLHKRAWREFLRSFGREVSDAELDFVLDGRKREEILRHFLGKDLSPEWVRAYGLKKDELFRKVADELAIVAGVDEFLAALSRAQVPMAVATSASKSRACSMLDRLKLLPYFLAVVTGDDVPAGKPNPTIFRKAAEPLGADPANVLVVEDAVSGVKAGKAAGMKCLGIAAAGRAHMLWDAGADHVIPNYSGLQVSDIQQLFH